MKTDSVPEIQCGGVNKVKTAMGFQYSQEDICIWHFVFFFGWLGAGGRELFLRGPTCKIYGIIIILG